MRSQVVKGNPAGHWRTNRHAWQRIFCYEPAWNRAKSSHQWQVTIFCFLISGPFQAYGRSEQSPYFTSVYADLALPCQSTLGPKHCPNLISLLRLSISALSWINILASILTGTSNLDALNMPVLGALQAVLPPIVTSIQPSPAQGWHCVARASFSFVARSLKDPSSGVKLHHSGHLVQFFIRHLDL